MKICHSEAMKQIKELEEQKRLLLLQERNRCTITYNDPKEERIKTNYSYGKTRAEVDALDKRVAKLRRLLAVANVTVILDGFDLTIGEGLVYLAQLMNKASVLENLSGREPLIRDVRYDGRAYYTECVYDVEKAADDLMELRNEVSRLQLSIDRTNLNSYIEV